MLFIRVLFKKGWTYKKIGVLAGIALALFIIGMVTTPSTKESFEAERKAEQQAALEKTKEKYPQSQEQQKQSNDTKKDKSDIIPGLEAADIKLNLEYTWDLVFSGPRIGEDLAQDSGKTVDPDTGATLICNIFETSPLHIQWVDFLIDAAIVAGTTSVDTINALAKGYFGYCATVPYDGAEPEKAKQWVINNVDKAVKPGNVLSTQIGPVTFEMFGTEYFRTLRIKPTGT